MGHSIAQNENKVIPGNLPERGCGGSPMNLIPEEKNTNIVTAQLNFNYSQEPNNLLLQVVGMVPTHQ